MWAPKNGVLFNVTAITLELFRVYVQKCNFIPEFANIMLKLP